MQTRTRTTRRSAMRRLPLAAAVALVFSSPLAWAQSADAPASPQDKEARTLDAITVTAQKRVENLQKVPISLQVLGNTQLEQQNVADFDDYAKMIPSLSYGTAGGGVSGGSAQSGNGTTLARTGSNTGPLVLVGGRLGSGDVIWGFAHASWRSTVAGITGSLPAAMTAAGLRPETARAVICPSAMDWIAPRKIWDW